jgi:sugar phosphate isomerase/epimerase
MARKKNPANSISRRNFIALSGMVPAVLSLQSLSTSAVAAGDEAAPVAKDKKYPIGLELYSVRNHLMSNLTETLREVAKIGYPLVEFYAPYFDWKIPHAKQIKSLMDDLGLRCYSTHNPNAAFTPGDTMSHAIELNQILGSRLLVLATSPGVDQGVEAWKKFCGQLTTASELLAPHGLSAGFHNHETEWKPLDGQTRAMDFLAANTPKEFVLQLDVGTCIAAGADSVAWVKANPGRIKVVHLKDWAPRSNPGEKGYRVLFGEGVTPWKELFAALESVGGVEFYLIEQEGSRFSEFETAQRCLDSWKKMRGETS